MKTRRELIEEAINKVQYHVDAFNRRLEVADEDIQRVTEWLKTLPAIFLAVGDIRLYEHNIYHMPNSTSRLLLKDCSDAVRIRAANELPELIELVAQALKEIV